MGQGLRTTVALVTAERLGVDPTNVQITCGDTNAPAQHITAGSWGTASACSAVDAACNKLRDEIFALAGEVSTIDASSVKALLERTGRDFIEADTECVAPGQTSQAFDRAAHGQVTIAGPEFPDFVTFSFVAQFVEVSVDPETFQVRVPRAVSVVDCGKVVSLRTARSQVFGGFVGGLSACLREASLVDPRFAGFLNTDIAEYHIPVNADIGEFTADFIDEPDTRFNSIGAKGMGEVVICGVAAAIANAIYHATGRRFRSLPIRLDDFHA
jgi:xanthine dehydrogenase YagR molybdenum-binding subunit